MNRPLLLSVNIDHVATLRQARGTAYPDPVEAAALAENAGAAGITAHLRTDRRHVQDDDVRRLRSSVRGKFNLEVSLDPGILEIVRRVRPDQVTLVPERPEEVTTEGGLDLIQHGSHVLGVAKELDEMGMEVSVFLDPDEAQVHALARLGNAAIRGFEINTDAWTKSDDTTSESELDRVRTVAAMGPELGFRVYAGHGLTPANVGPIAALPEVEEMNIGHWLVSRSTLLGMRGAVGEMLRAMRDGRR